MPRGLGLRVCAFIHCAELTATRYCPEHTKVVRKRSHSEFRKLYSSRKWRIFRLTILKRDGFRCQWPEGKCRRWATQVDHIIPLTEYQGSPYDRRNVQSLCEHHHGVKTAQEVWGDRKRDAT